MKLDPEHSEISKKIPIKPKSKSALMGGPAYESIPFSVT